MCLLDPTKDTLRLYIQHTNLHKDQKGKKLKLEVNFTETML